MATHVLDPGVSPEVNPTGASSNDYESIQANPDDFGAGIGRATQGLGQATTTAGDTGLDVLTQKAKINGDLMANDAATQYTKGVTQAWGDYANNHQGKDALSALPDFQNSLDTLRQKISKTLPSTDAQLAFDGFSRRAQDHYLESSQTFADAQNKQWIQKSWTDGAANAGDQASLFRSDPSKVEAWLKTSDDQLKNLYDDTHADPESSQRGLLENRGRNVRQLVEQSAVSGLDGKPDVHLAQEYFNKYKDSIDQGSQLRIAEFLKNRVDQQSGIDFGKGAMQGTQATHGFASPALPVFAHAAASVPSGYSPAGLSRTIQIESGGNPNAGNGSHLGLGQFSPSTWAQYGEGSRTDPQQAILATQRYAAANASYLSQHIGRQPTDSDLYLAHQQGPGGAAKLLLFPNARAGDLVGDAAIRGNGGDPNAPASAFTNLWSAKFGGHGVPTTIPGGGQTFQLPPGMSGANPRFQPSTPDAGSPPDLPTFATATTPGVAGLVPQIVPPPAGPEAIGPGRSVDNIPPPVNPKADAFQQINDAETSGQLSHEAAQHARSYVSQQITAKQVADSANAAAIKQRNDARANVYVSKMLSGDTDGLMEAIAKDPGLTWETRRSLGDAVQKETSDGSRESAKHYGNGFFSALKAVTAPAGDPTRIDNPTTLLSRVGPGGDLTLSGYEKLNALAKLSAKDVNGASENRLREHAYSYANERMTYTIPSYIPGQPDKRDPRGTELFNSVFIPQVEAASEKWVAGGHSLSDPNSPVSKKNIDAMIETIRPKRQMDAERVSALQGATGDTPSAAPVPPVNVPPPPPVQGVDKQAWNRVVTAPPATISSTKWGAALTMLATNPTPENIALFNKSQFGRAGQDGAKLLEQLRGADGR